MKWLIASDIHGSMYYLNKLIERIDYEKPDKIILLGDILYHGPRNDLPKDYNPKEVIKTLNNLKINIVSVRGNCDAEVDQMVLNFPIMACYAFLDLNGYSVYLTHGHIYNKKNLLPMNNGDILLCGHTHIQNCEEFKTNENTYTYMNCGSTSIPKENGYHGYMIIAFDGKTSKFIWKDLDGVTKNIYTK